MPIRTVTIPPKGGGSGSGRKATFGLEQSIIGDETDWYQVRKAGTFTGSFTSVREAPAGSVYLDIQKSSDHGTNWFSIYADGSSNKIVVPTGSHGQVQMTIFAAPPDNGIAVGDYLRQLVLSGSSQDAEGLNTVLEWE